MKPKFSVIIPTYSELTPKQEGAAGHTHFRGLSVQRAIKSIINQQFPDWELILIDDGCVDEITPDILDKFAASDPRIRVIHKINENRAIARNRGMEEAKGEWLCWLDSDDEYSSHYLREIDQATKDFPDYQIFNFGSLIYWPDHRTDIRPAFTPAIEGDGHEYFRSGHIGCGSFVFKKSLWASNSKYRIPDEVNAYQFAAASKFDLRLNREEDAFKYDNTENPEGAMSDGVYRHGTSLGNPWGDDFFQFYLLTRDNQSKPLDVLLYFQYPRSHEDIYEHFGAIYDVTFPS
jgi:glycosyltransferase involved in cell wall biosynthesis